MSPAAPVLILGAGINGVCVARELILNRVPVWLVDTRDIAFGATAKSSRLIHGGLRYLEYGDFTLVRESLHERDRLLQWAGDEVTPLRLHIPVRRRTGGLLAAGLRFVGGQDSWLGRRLGRNPGRGLWTVRLGLWLYDWLAGSRHVPGHAVHRTGAASGPAFPPDQFPWHISYFDAQLVAPERFCLTMLHEIREQAQQTGVPFEVRTYHRANWRDGAIQITPTLDADHSSPVTIHPSLIVNATGAWGDHTLRELAAPAPSLFGGTKGTHLFTAQAQLREALNGEAVYAEARDGRLVFLIPLPEAVMIGTTDDRFEGRPEEAHATPAEIDYLLQLTNEIFPQVALQPSDIYAHCAGIRPLPSVDTSRTAAIPRGHSVNERTVQGLPVLTLIGGKLTTCRAFGEEVADRILALRGEARIASTRDRPIGKQAEGESLSATQVVSSLAARTWHSQATCSAVWSLLHGASESVLATISPQAPLIAGTAWPRPFIEWLIDHEWVATLEDLVERRLLLALAPELRRETLVDLAETLHARRPTLGTVEQLVNRTIERLRTDYGRTLPM